MTSQEMRLSGWRLLVAAMVLFAHSLIGCGPPDSTPASGDDNSTPPGHAIAEAENEPRGNAAPEPDPDPEPRNVNPRTPDALDAAWTGDPVRVLLIDSRPRYSWRNLEKFLCRQASIRFRGFNSGYDRAVPQPRTYRSVLRDGETPLQPLQTLPPADTPEDRQAFFDGYDVVILGDVKRRALGKAFTEMLSEFVVRHGGGLVFIAGASNPATYVNSPLEQLVPVKLDSLDPFHRPWSTYEKRYVFKAAGRAHEMLRFADDDDVNTRAWRSVHGYYWFATYREEKPGATVLMRHPKRTIEHRVEMETEYPLMVLQSHGRGLCLFIGTDDLWYMTGQGMETSRYGVFWLQVIRHMASSRR